MFDKRSMRQKDIYDLIGRFRLPIIALIIVCTIGILGFMLISGYPFVDAVYQTVFTLSTVGFQETHPLSPSGRIFVTFLILGGVAVWTYALGVTISVVVNDGLIEKIREALMEHQIAGKQDHFIIAGYTDISRQLVRNFRRQEVDFVVLDDDANRVALAADDGVNEILPLQPFLNASYRRANVAKARGIISTFSDDSDNITVVATGKIMEEEIKRPLLVISLANRQESKAKLLKIGADVVLMPHELIGQRISAMAMHPPDRGEKSFLDRVAFGEFLNLDIREVTIERGSSLDGKSIRESGLRTAIGAHILGVRRRRSKRLLLMPPPDLHMHEGDEVLIMGTLAQLQELPLFLNPQLAIDGEKQAGG